MLPSIEKGAGFYT